MSEAAIIEAPVTTQPAAVPVAPPGGFLATPTPAVVTAPVETPQPGTLSQPSNIPTRLLAPDFRDGDTDNLREGWSEAFEKMGHTRLANKAATHKTEADFWKSLDHMAQFVGKKTGYLPPTDKSTPEEIAAYREQVGAPAESKDYAFKPAKMPDGIEWNGEQGAKAEAILHKWNVPKGASQELADLYGDTLLQAQVEARTKFESDVTMKAQECERTFKDEWGANYNERLAANKDFAKVLFGDELTDPIIQAALARPSVVRLIDQTRREIRGVLPGANGDAQGSQSPGQQAQELMLKNPNWASDPSIHSRIKSLFELQAQIDSRRAV